MASSISTTTCLTGYKVRKEKEKTLTSRVIRVVPPAPSRKSTTAKPPQANEGTRLSVGIMLGSVLLVLLVFCAVAGFIPSFASAAELDEPFALSPQKALDQMGIKLNWDEVRTNRQAAEAQPLPKRVASGGGDTSSGNKNKLISWRANWNHYNSPPAQPGTATTWWLQTTVAREGQGLSLSYRSKRDFKNVSARVMLPPKEAGSYAAGFFMPVDQVFEMGISWLNGALVARTVHNTDVCEIGPDIHLMYEAYPGGSVYPRVAIDNHSLYQHWYVGVVGIGGSNTYYYRADLSIDEEDFFGPQSGLIVVATDESMTRICSMTMWEDFYKSLYAPTLFDDPGAGRPTLLRSH